MTLTSTQTELFFITPEHIKLLGDAQRANDSAKKATDKNNTLWDDATAFFVNAIGVDTPTLDDDGNETKDDDGKVITHKVITAKRVCFLTPPTW